MDGEADVYFIDGRNAVVRDHRTPGRASGGVVATRQPPYVPPAPASYAGPAYPVPGYATAPTPYWGGQPPYMQPPPWGWGQPGTLGGLFSGVNIGTLIDLLGQGFAAIRSLPTPPTASGDSGTDVANLTLYQTALAEHGKTDERIRTAVHIMAKLLGG